MTADSSPAQQDRIVLGQFQSPRVMGVSKLHKKCCLAASPYCTVGTLLDLPPLVPAFREFCDPLGSELDQGGELMIRPAEAEGALLQQRVDDQVHLKRLELVFIEGNLSMRHSL